MGKGNRNSQQRINDRLANEEKNLAREKARKSQKNTGRWVSVACIVIAALIVAILVLNVLAETGVFIRATDAITIADDKDIAVNAAMMTYFVHDFMNDWYNNYYVYVMYGLLSVNMSRDLTTQKITSNDASYLGDSTLVGTTWYDYFMDSTVESVEMYVIYAYNGKNIPECALTDEDYAEIDETISELKKSLKDNGTTLAEMYGRGVTMSDVRACYELIQRAVKFGEYKQDVIKAELEANDAPVVAYPEDNKASFYSAKYLSYTINVSEKTEKTQEAYDKAVADAKAAVEKITAAKTPAEFVNLVELYKKSPSSFISGAEEAAESTTETATESTTEKETTVEELIDKYTSTITWQTGNELADWIFSETVEEGDVKVITETSTETVTETGTETEAETQEPYEKFKITAYMLLEESDLDHALTHNMAYLISDNKAAAEQFLAAFKANTTKTRDEFVRIAEEHYDALHASHDHSAEDHVEPTFSFSSVDKAKEDYFAADYDAVNVWLDDAARVDGQYTESLIEISVKESDGNTKTYYAVVLFEKHDVEAWYADAFTGATQKKIEDWYKAEQDKKTVSFNWDVIDDIL